MRHDIQRHLLPAMAIIAILLTACMADEVGGVYIITSSVDTLHAVENQTAEIIFNASGKWRALPSEDWLEVSPKTGEGGRNLITVRTSKQNRTKQPRVAQIVITSDEKGKSVPIVQRGDFAFFDSKVYEVDADGEDVEMSFTTNVEKGKLYVSYLKYKWYSLTETEEKTRTGEWSGRIKKVTVYPNDSSAMRSAHFFLGIYDERKQFMVLDSTCIRQEGR